MSGSLFNLAGNYHQCLGYLKSEGLIEATRYCVARISADTEANKALAPLTGQPRVAPAGGYRSLKVGLCVPESCSAPELINLTNRLVKQFVSRSHVECDQVDCYPDSQLSQPHWSGPTIAAALIVIGLLLAITLASVLDLYSSSKSTPVGRSATIGKCFVTLKALSVRRGLNLLAGARTRGIKLAALDGLRVISMLWIITIHSYSFAFQWMSFANTKQVDEVFKSASTQWIANGTFSVDNFFLLSGLLASLKRKSKMGANQIRANRETRSINSDKTRTSSIGERARSFLASCLDRYLRLAPTLVLLILLSQLILPSLARGPGWANSTSMFDAWCRNNWPINLFMLHNFIRTSSMCFSHSWYIAVDFQLFVLVSLVALVLGKHSQNRHLLILAVLSQGAIAAVVVAQDLVSIPLLPTRSLEALIDFFRLLYIKPHYWFASYAIGCCLAVYLPTNAKRPSWPTLSKWANCLQVGCLMLMLILVTLSLPYFRSAPEVMPTWQSALYSFLARPLWSACLACLLFFILADRGHSTTSVGARRKPLVSRLLAALLTWRVWLPLSRLTYSAYLLHPLVMACFYGSRVELFSFSHELLLYFTLANIIITYICALLIYLIIEFPAQFTIKQIKKRYFTVTSSRASLGHDQSAARSYPASSRALDSNPMLERKATASCR